MATRIPEPTVGKILKALARADLLESQRGINGGYTLARAPQDINVTEIIAAVDGPIALTDCLDAQGEACSMETFCPTRSNWQKINDTVREALERVSLTDMMDPIPSFVPPAAGDDRRALGL